LIIAEIGNSHFGSIKKARELIRAAHESGADVIKGQAFKADDIKIGSMPFAFYKECELSIHEYIELIDYARDIGNDLFYSIFSNGFDQISMYQNWHKIAGSQTRQGKATDLHDIENMIISVPSESNLLGFPKFKKAELCYVSEYMTKDPCLGNIQLLSKWLGRQVGYSDHTVGIDFAKIAYSEFGAHIIEKHFCLTKNEEFSGVVFRDTVHGATPQEFETLAHFMSE
jgi:sialic acid synthase SpsE